ncbi:MAG: hypothetical protein ACE5Z5_15500, partial [Candidatus Bathyarchaeia archaeon]
PVTIMSLTDIEALELSLIENVQRKNLTIEDEAGAYARLIEAHGSMREVSRRTGVSHVHICEVLMCRETQQRLQHHGIKVERMPSGPKGGSSTTTLPIRHAVLLEQTFRNLGKSGKLSQGELDRRYVEAARLIAGLSQREAGELLKRLAQSPERPLDELMGEVRARRSTSQKVHRLRLSEHLYGRLSEEAEKRGLSVEDLATIIIEEWLEGRLNKNIRA